MSKFVIEPNKIYDVIDSLKADEVEECEEA